MSLEHLLPKRLTSHSSSSTSSSSSSNLNNYGNRELNNFKNSPSLQLPSLHLKTFTQINNLNVDEESSFYDTPTPEIFQYPPTSTFSNQDFDQHKIENYANNQNEMIWQQTQQQAVIDTGEGNTERRNFGNVHYHEGTSERQGRDKAEFYEPKKKRKKSIPGFPWTPDSDARFVELCQKHENDFKVVAKILSQEYTSEDMLSEMDCIERYKVLYGFSERTIEKANSLSFDVDDEREELSETELRQEDNEHERLAIKKGTWSKEEDELLLRLIHSEEKLSWGDICKRIPGRSAKQCRERWSYNLDPNINKDLWSPEEDRLLIESQSKLGNRWAQIAALLPGRTENAVKTRFKSILRAKKREWSPAEDEIILNVHAVHGSCWDKMSEEILKKLTVARTKNAVKMRYRLLSKGKARLVPAYGAPNQIFFQLSGTNTNKLNFEKLNSIRISDLKVVEDEDVDITEKVDVIQRSEFVKKEAKLIEERNFDDLIRVSRRNLNYHSSEGADGNFEIECNNQSTVNNLISMQQLNFQQNYYQNQVFMQAPHNLQFYNTYDFGTNNGCNYAQINHPYVMDYAEPDFSMYNSQARDG